MPRATPPVSAVGLSRPPFAPRSENTPTNPEMAPSSPSNGEMPTMSSSAERPRSRRTISRRAAVWIASALASRDWSSSSRPARVMRARAAGFSSARFHRWPTSVPGVSFSMAARRKRGSTRSRCSARTRTIVMTTAASAHTASGTMNGPPRSKNPTNPSQRALPTNKVNTRAKK